VAIIEDGAVRKTGCFGCGGGARRELDVDYVIVREVLRRKRAGRRAVEEVDEGGCTFQRGGINTTGRVVDQDHALQTRNRGRLEIRAGQIWDQLLEQWDVGTRGFERQIGLGTDDQVRGFEVSQGGNDLRSIEGRVEWHLSSWLSMLLVTCVCEEWRRRLTRTAPSLKMAYVAYHLSALCFCLLLACYSPAYNAVLNAVPQRDGHSITFLDTSLLQASRQAVTLQIEMMICQSLALVSGYDSARRMSLSACHTAVCYKDELTRDGHRAGPQFRRSGLPPYPPAEAAFRD